ncbi:MAG: aldo/keto reductase [Pseudomonadota bacterium]
MERRRLGRTDIDVSCLGLGTMMYGDQIGERDAFEQMDYALDVGINLFDMAELYTIPPKPETAGECERIVGRWLTDRKRRGDVVVASKIAGRSDRLSWLREDGRLTRIIKRDILEAVEGSLKRLNVETIDLYQIHWPDRLLPVFGGDLRGYKHYEEDYAPFEETLDIFQELIREGKIRHLGLSNETSWGAMRFLQASASEGRPRMQSIQNIYNLVSRVFEYGLAEIAMNEDMGLLAYSPLGQGALLGKYLDGKAPAGTRGALFGRLGRYETPSANNAIIDYLKVAESFDVDPAHMALQFVTTRPWVTSNLFGASSMEQLKRNVASLEMRWTDEIEAAVNAVHARYPNPCP